MEKSNIEKINEVKVNFLEKFKSGFIFTGFIVAGIAGIAYIILLVIIVLGFSVDIGKESLLIFLTLGALDGILITGALRLQGFDFAKSEKEVKKVLDEYNDLIAKDTKNTLRPLWWYVLFSTIKDIVFKGISIVLTLFFTITVMIEGVGDVKYIWLGIFNVLMFLGFGILSMVKAYDHYLNNEVILIKQKILKLKKEDKDELFKEVTGNCAEGIRDIGRSENAQILTDSKE